MNYLIRCLLLITATSPSLAWAQLANSVAGDNTESQQREGDWHIQRDSRTGVVQYTRELTLHPKKEPRPALKHRFIADPFDQVEGNSAIFYLKAMGFFEETRARLEIEKFEREAREKAEGRDDIDGVAPHVWYTMPLNELPVEEAKQFMKLLDFQPGFLREAALRTDFSLDRNIRAVRNPVSYLLPEIQVMRQLARMQKIRVRIALRENRIADAIELQGHQHALAAHLGTDEFLVSTLVGAAIASMAWDDSLSLVEQADTPNLYWAFAALPKPLIDMKNAMSYERQFLFEQVKALRDVDETRRPAGYWVSFLDRIGEDLLPILNYEMELRLDSDPEISRAQLVTAIGASYPGAAQYLVKECNLDAAKVRSYPQLQTVLLATRRFYERARDNIYKWCLVDYAQANGSSLRVHNEQDQQREATELGWAAQPADTVLTAFHAVRAAQQRVQQSLAMLQTVEAIRLYAAEHEGQLPHNLAALTLPAPVDPFTGQALAYEHNGDNATLSGSQTATSKYRLILRIAK